MAATPDCGRVVKANDRSFNSQFKYANNYIKTSKYNIFTFIPINLFEQFMRIANFYFLILLILQFIDVVSSLNPVTTALPLVFVLTVSAVKDGIDDYKRHKSDGTVNNRTAEILVCQDTKRDLVATKWHHVQVGDIIKLYNNDFVTADILVLSSSEPHSVVYVETAELDGETNLKVKQALPETSPLGQDLEKLGNFNGEVQCEAPNNRLDRYEGTLNWGEEKFSLNNDQLLLRGCRIRNTQWCYGIVIFAGKDTKLMQNSGKSKLKRTSLDKLMNKLVISIFILMLVICLICSICCSVWEYTYGEEFQVYLPWDQKNGAIIATLNFFSYIIVLNTLVPISLYVTVELIRLFQSFWINWDVKMYYETKDCTAKARTTTLNEELGQIQYVFSDKTGTLTQNMMTFNKCSISGRKFGEFKNKAGDIVPIDEDTPKVDFSSNKYYEESFEFYDNSLKAGVDRGDRQTWLFFRLLALCHTVMAEHGDDGSLTYQAQSPDEAALVGAARNFGFTYKSRTPTTITIEVQGREDTYELLQILDFNNVRKRMSVIVRQNNRIKLFCKGADNVVFERLGEASTFLKDVTQEHLNDFANEGLRTLVLAMKDIGEQEYKDWNKKYHEASTSLENREEKIDAVQEEIEKDMMLLGATAIEDKLQDGVPETIENLIKGNIKVWVLTGDKQETAINIGYSCRLLTDEFNEVFVINQTEEEAIKEVVNNTLDKICDTMGIKNKMRCDEDDIVDEDDDEEDEKKNMEQLASIYSFAIVITGASLVHALQADIEQIFLEAACFCKTIICCRVTPLQKAQVVNLVKKYKKAVTLAIGDGANDVSMIKAAHIGVGISGQEGMQAVLASDFSFGQFRFLERLLLVHGRWSYVRMSKFLSYFFYKNFAFTLSHFWFAFYCGFSAMAVYDQWFITLYNIVFTSLPVIALGIFDQDVNEDMCVRFPALYKPGQKNEYFNYWVFTKSIVSGTITSLTLFFISYGTFLDVANPDGFPAGSQTTFGCILASMLVLVVNFKMAMDTAYWTVFNHICIWLSIISYWIIIFTMYSDIMYEFFFAIFTFIGSARIMSTMPTFWFSMPLVCVILLMPVAGKRAISMDVAPTLAEKVRMLQQREAQQAKEDKDNVVELKSLKRIDGDMNGKVIKNDRPKSRKDSVREEGISRKRPQSAGSGYAFSHQEGFGRMITSGTIRDSQRRKKGREKNGTASTDRRKSSAHSRDTDSGRGSALKDEELIV
ncbi:probable phospholipid-transporting ATPase IM [Anneissia japonica]|uniref:probable phospholipid-transporting ATPase IM n=1 Tax=Anneissia japonica TaxID=1529436 RepID=UPI00142574CF|nr:probable phospholipid-transporting ATPase IM [Anneissia japonica]XP_033107553.1 probable phospholipid-transporting ATPase IM [Anneissia japonica]XP_033107554.1 probable phospholipid-transporting ATPase IM [Anneissia japonica]